MDRYVCSVVVLVKDMVMVESVWIVDCDRKCVDEGAVRSVVGTSCGCDDIEFLDVEEEEESREAVLEVGS